MAINLIIYSKKLVLSGNGSDEFLLSKAEVLVYSLTQSYLTNGKRLPNLELRNLKNEKVALADLLKNKKAVLFVYSEISCNACIDSLLDECNVFANSTDSDTIVLGIAYSPNIHYLRKFARDNKLKFILLWDEYGEFEKFLNLQSLPAILIANREGIIINSLFFDYSIREFSHTFIDAMYQTLNQNM